MKFLQLLVLAACVAGCGQQVSDTSSLNSYQQAHLARVSAEWEHRCGGDRNWQDRCLGGFWVADELTIFQFADIDYSQRHSPHTLSFNDVTQSLESDWRRQAVPLVFNRVGSVADLNERNDRIVLFDDPEWAATAVRYAQQSVPTSVQYRNNPVCPQGVCPH